MSDTGNDEPYPYRVWSTGYNVSQYPDDMIRQYDMQLGAFTRIFASCEFLIKNILLEKLQVERTAAMFLLSKMGAGQTAALFKDFVEAGHLEGKTYDHALKAAKQFLGLSGFRNDLAHGSHMFGADCPVLLRFPAKSVKGKADAKKLTSAEMDKKIDQAYRIYETLVGVIGKVYGYKEEIEDIIKQATSGGVIQKSPDGPLKLRKD